MRKDRLKDNKRPVRYSGDKSSRQTGVTFFIILAFFSFGPLSLSYLLCSCFYFLFPSPSFLSLILLHQLRLDVSCMPELVQGLDSEIVPCRHLRKYYKWHIYGRPTAAYLIWDLAHTERPLVSRIQGLCFSILSLGIMNEPELFLKTEISCWDAHCPLIFQKTDVLYNINLC